MTSQDTKDAFTHVTVNVLDFQSGNPTEMAMAECGYERTDNLMKMDKYKVMALKYSNSSTDTPIPTKPQKHCYTFFGGDITLCL